MKLNKTYNKLISKVTINRILKISSKTENLYKMPKIILLGTGGGPRIWADRSQPASAIVIDDSVYIIDTGDGVCGQLAKAKIDPEKIRAVFITHNHSDHMADFGTLLLRSWQSGHKGKIRCFGPKPISSIINSYCEYMNWDIKLRIKDENRPDFKSMFKINEIGSDNQLYLDENISVDCIRVPHGSADPSYAFRFNVKGQIVVFSGDTSKSDKLIEFAKNADYLIHEVLNVDGVDAIIQRTYPGNTAFRKHILEAHTTMREVGDVAKKSNVKNLILNHLVPTGSPIFDKDEVWKEGVSKTFDGNIIVGEDLKEIEI